MDESEKWKGSCSVVSDSSRPHGLQLSRLLHPWHFPGKSTGVGCHCLLRNSSLKTLYYLAFVCSLCSSLVTLLSAPALLACLFFLEHWASSDPGPLLLPFLCLEIISFIFFFPLVSPALKLPLSITSQIQASRECDPNYHLSPVLLPTLWLWHIKRVIAEVPSCLVLFITLIQFPDYPFSHFTLTLFIGPMLLSFWIMPLSIRTRTLPVCPGDVHLNCALEMHLPSDSDPGNISSWGLSPGLPMPPHSRQNLDIMSLRRQLPP